MHINRKRSYFPLVILILSLGLVLFMVYSLTYTNTNSNNTKELLEVTEPINTNEYRVEMQNIIASYKSEYQNASDDLSKLIVVERVIGKLLTIRVPDGYKEMHLELVVNLHTIKQGLLSTKRDISIGQEKLNRTFARFPWLSE